MKERIRKIIAYIMDVQSDETGDPSGMYSRLEEMGYSLEEIGQALTILDFEPVQDDFTPGSLMHSKNRILGEGEKLFLTTEAQGYLIRLNSTGWLSETQLNIIIENAGMEYPIPVSLREIIEVTSRYVPEIPDDILAGAETRADSLN